MANSVDPDQTAPSGSTLFAYVILSDALVFEFLGHLLYIQAQLHRLYRKVIFLYSLHYCRDCKQKLCKHQEKMCLRVCEKHTYSNHFVNLH